MNKNQLDRIIFEQVNKVLSETPNTGQYVSTGSTMRNFVLAKRLKVGETYRLWNQKLDNPEVEILQITPKWGQYYVEYKIIKTGKEDSIPLSDDDRFFFTGS